MKNLRTQVGIVGAGPAGLLLSHLLARAGIDSIIVEDRSREYVETRVRAGVLEQASADTFVEIGLGDRMQREGQIHDGIEIRFNGKRHRIDFPSLTGGKRITVYGQQEAVRDMIAARLGAGGVIYFEAADVAIHGVDGDRPSITFRDSNGPVRVECDYIAGCDGSHGVCRASMPSGTFTEYERVYPFAWLGILTEAAQASRELIYAHHERGFALLSTRSPAIQRYYLQVDPDEDIEKWPDDRIWEELQVRTATGDSAFRIPEGPITQKSITAMRSFVVAPMRCGRLYLAGDAAHIVPPTGAKGMNLAMADVRFLTEALVAHYRQRDDDLLAGYSARCLRRVWKAQRFSWWMTTMLHVNYSDTPFDRKRQIAELDYTTSSHAAMTALAENYVGLPFDQAEAA